MRGGEMLLIKGQSQVQENGPGLKGSWRAAEVWCHVARLVPEGEARRPLLKVQLQLQWRLPWTGDAWTMK